MAYPSVSFVSVGMYLQWVLYLVGIVFAVITPNIRTAIVFVTNYVELPSSVHGGAFGSVVQCLKKYSV